MLFCRKSLLSLQHAGGAYCLVAAHKDRDVRASLRGFEEGDNLRVLRAKDDEVPRVVDGVPVMQKKPEVRYPGYALKLTLDIPVGKAIGVLKVNVCWHDIVVRNEWGFAERYFLY